MWYVLCLQCSTAFISMGFANEWWRLMLPTGSIHPALSVRWPPAIRVISAWRNNLVYTFKNMKDN